MEDSKMKKVDSTSVHTVAILAEILCRFVDKVSKSPVSDEKKVAKVTAAIEPTIVEGAIS